MTSTAIGLPDRYRPLDRVGPDEITASGAITTWRAKDRVLNRDVAIRVHTPGGAAAHGWIARALTAGGLATPALAMVYDASEGTASEGTAGSDGAGAVAYVVNEWIEGETLAERLDRGPLPEREARTVLRRLAEGVAEAHRVGLAVGGLTPDNVVLRPNGLVGLRGVPAATGTVAGDVAALGELLEFALTGRTGEDTGAVGRSPGMPPDLAALIRRARSTEPGQGLSSVAAMAALLAERPRTGPNRPVGRTDDESSRRRRGDRGEAAGPDAPSPTIAVDATPSLHADPYGEVFGDDYYDEDYDEDDAAGEVEAPSARRRVLVVGLPLLALALVIAVAVWLGTNVLSVASSVDQVSGSTPSDTATPSAAAPSSSAAAPAAATLPITGASVFDPYGDGEPENSRQVPRSHDGDPASAWSTLNYRGSAHFGNLKPGVGVVYDLGSAHDLTGVTVETEQPGATVEIRTSTTQGTRLDAFSPAGTATLDARTEVSFAKPVNARYVLVWVTGLVPSPKGFSADLAEVSVQSGR